MFRMSTPSTANTERCLNPLSPVDKEALGRLLSSLSDQLYSAAFRLLGSHEEAKTRYRTACLPRPEM